MGCISVRGVSRGLLHAGYGKIHGPIEVLLKIRGISVGAPSLRALARFSLLRTPDICVGPGPLKPRRIAIVCFLFFLFLYYFRKIKSDFGITVQIRKLFKFVNFRIFSNLKLFKSLICLNPKFVQVRNLFKSKICSNSKFIRI
jgi:hypothetical protein